MYRQILIVIRLFSSFIFSFCFLFGQDGRSPLSNRQCGRFSSAESSDGESSSIEVAGSSQTKDNQTYRRKRQSQTHQPQPHQNAVQQIKTETNQASQQMLDELGKTFGTNNSLNNLLYPGALDNLPQVVLMNLVQNGHLQVGEEGTLLPLLLYSIHRLNLQPVNSRE